MTQSRRDVLATLTACSACAALGTCASDALAFETNADPVDLGAVAAFAEPGVYDQFAKSHKLLLIRTKEKLIAASSICTHKRCVLKKKDDHLRCPCHGSEFDIEGIPLGGQAKTSLPRYAIKIENDRVMVDPSKMFDERQWDDAGASVKFEPAK